MKFPEIVDIEFTAFCNLKCGFCFGPVDDRSIPNLPTAFWIDALKWIAEAGAKGIVISGGEPTLHRDICLLLKTAKSLDLSIVMSTHGQIRKRVVECAVWADWIAIPVDGVSHVMLKTMRGKVWGINNAITLIQEMRAKNPNLGIKLGTVATKQNILEVPLVGKELLERQVPINTWKVYQYTARRKFKERWKEFHLDDEQFSIVISSIELALPAPHFDIVYSSRKSRQRAYLFIYPDGNVAVPSTTGGEDFTFGNLYYEGPDVLKRVSGYSINNHISNYQNTYPSNKEQYL